MTVPSAGQPPQPSGKTVAVLITLTVLLMAFSMASALLGNPTMAASTGAVASGLIVDICRRLLGGTHGAPTATPMIPSPVPGGSALVLPQTAAELKPVTRPGDER